MRPVTEQYPNAGLLRRLAAITYDSFFVVAIWMMTTILLVGFVTDGEEVKGPLYQLLLYVELFSFYYAFWRIKGQTLGMQIWKIRLQDESGYVPDSMRCIVRFLAATPGIAAAGIGLLWMLLDRERRTLYDIASKTRVVYLGKNPYPSEQRQ